MYRLPGPDTVVACAGTWGDVLHGGGITAPDGPRIPSSRQLAAQPSLPRPTGLIPLDDHFATTSRARRVIAARAWGRALARLHRHGATAPIDRTYVKALGAYRFDVITDGARPLHQDASDDLAQACAWLLGHLRRSSLDSRAAMAAFLDGYRCNGGAGRLAAIPA